MQEFWRSKLSPNQRRWYVNMFLAFSKHKECVIGNNLAPQEISRAYLAINNDHPEFYQLPYNPRVLQSIGAFGCKTELIIHNIYNQFQIRSIDVQIAELRKRLLSLIPENASEYEKEKAICDFILENIKYEINNQFNQNAASVLVEHKGQCSGIAKAVKLMLGWIGIESIIVNGNAIDNTSAINGPHAWNIVWINNKSYHLDVTFMLGANLKKCKPFKYLYMNYNDDEMSFDHIWDREETPCCDSVWNCRMQQAQSITSEGLCPIETISSLYEFKEKLKIAILAGNCSFSFYSQIPVNDDELIGIIGNACKITLELMRQTLRMSIRICNRLVSVSW